MIVVITPSSSSPFLCTPKTYVGRFLVRKHLAQCLPSAATLSVYIHGLFALGLAMSGVFFNVFLFRGSENLDRVVFFNLIGFIVGPIFFVLNGMLLRAHSLTAGLRAGLLGNALFFFLLIVLRDRASAFLAPLAILDGAADGMYWSSLHLLSYESTHDLTRNFYFGLRMLWQDVASLFGPALAGWIIASKTMASPYASDLSGYYNVFSLVAIIFAAGAALSFLLPKQPPRPFSFRVSLELHKKNAAWMPIVKSLFFEGFRGGVFGFLIGLAFFMILGGERDLGIALTIAAAIAIAADYIFGNFLKPKNRIGAVAVAVILMALSTSILAVGFSVAWLAISIIIGSICGSLFSIAASPIRYAAIDQERDPHISRYEYITSSELVLSAGKVLGVVLVFPFLFWASAEMAIRATILLFGFIPFIVYWYLRQAERQIAGAREPAP